MGIDRGTYHIRFKVEGAQSRSPGYQPIAAFRAVSTGYLRALGAPLLMGSWPRSSEAFDSFVVNQAFARSEFGSVDPIGRRITTGFLNGTVVGVVGDFKYWKLDAEPSPQVYFPYQLSPEGRSVRVLVRTKGNPGAVAPMVRKVASSIDPTQPLYQFQTLQQALSNSIAPRRFNLFLLAAFALISLMMALVGIYGVTAYAVTQRTQEIGIRMALGAQKGDVLRLVLGQGMVPTLVGVSIGIAGAFGLTRLLRSMLYAVTPTDPVTFVAVSLLMIGVALMASYVPARRAARVDPMLALRHE